MDFEFRFNLNTITTMIKNTNIFSRKSIFAIMFARINKFLKTCVPSWKHVWIFNHGKAFPGFTSGCRKSNVGNLNISATV